MMALPSRLLFLTFLLLIITASTVPSSCPNSDYLVSKASAPQQWLEVENLLKEGARGDWAEGTFFSPNHLVAVSIR